MESFKVVANVPIEQPPAIERIGNAALGHMQALGTAFTGYLGEVASNIREDVSLGLFDAKHGTDMYSRKYSEIERRKIARYAAKHAIQL